MGSANHFPVSGPAAQSLERKGTVTVGVGGAFERRAGSAPRPRGVGLMEATHDYGV